MGVLRFAAATDADGFETAAAAAPKADQITASSRPASDARMVYSRHQLQERMTLTWHEHFATSAEKVRIGYLMHLQEDFLRRNCLGKFRDLLRGITKDQAMLIWLDNDYNKGNATDDQGNPIPPNRNYARELLQVFATGPVMLNMNGTPVLDANRIPLPAYTEQDVNELARALTGWHVDYHRHRYRAAVFEEWLHDAGNKTSRSAHP